VKDTPKQGTSWLDVLKNMGVEAISEAKNGLDVALSSEDEFSESLNQQGAKSAKSLLTMSDTEENSGVVNEEAKPKEPQRTLVTSQDQLADVVADLKDADLVALDLETSGLNPRKDSIRLLSLATEAGTYIADCQSVNPSELFPILAERTLVAHNALFDLGFLSSLGFEPGKVADTMILSQLLHSRLESGAPEEGANLSQPRLRSKARARARA